VESLKRLGFDVVSTAWKAKTSWGAHDKVFTVSIDCCENCALSIACMWSLHYITAHRHMKGHVNNTIAFRK
jgi:hypothetical protein